MIRYRRRFKWTASHFIHRRNARDNRIVARSWERYAHMRKAPSGLRACSVTAWALSLHPPIPVHSWNQYCSFALALKLDETALKMAMTPKIPTWMSSHPDYSSICAHKPESRVDARFSKLVPPGWVQVQHSFVFFLSQHLRLTAVIGKMCRLLRTTWPSTWKWGSIPCPNRIRLQVWWKALMLMRFTETWIFCSEHLSLESSMKSWKANGLLEYVQETYLYIDGGDPAIREKIESVGKSYGFTVMNQESNVGLGKALGLSPAHTFADLELHKVHFSVQRT